MKFHSPRDWIREHKIASACGTALLLVVLLLVGTRYRAQWRLAEYKKQLEAQGEKLTIAELIPPLPSGSNGGPALVRAVGFIPATLPQPLGMKLTVAGVARVAWQQSELLEDISQNQMSALTNIWPLLDEQLPDSREAFADLRTAARNPEIFFEPDYAQGFAVLLPHLAKLKKGALYLSTAAIYELHAHDAKAALDDICLGLSLAERDHEPLMISQLVRCAMASIHFNATWEALQSDEWTDAQLQQLQSAWERLEFIRDADSCLAMDRAMGMKEVEFTRTSYNHLQNLNSAGSGLATVGLDEFMELGKGVMQDPIAGLKAMGSRYPGYWWWCWSWTYDDERALMNYWQDLHEEFQSAGKSHSVLNRLDRFDKGEWIFDGSKMAEANNLHYLVTLMLAGGNKFLIRVTNIELQRNLAITAIALKRFHLREKKYPAQLDELIPRDLKVLPLDWFAGKPLRYQLQGDGSFLLYSIGPDGVDNHGDATMVEKNPRPIWIRGRDLVWPRAATTEEAAAFAKQQIANANKVEPVPTLVTTNQTTATNR